MLTVTAQEASPGAESAVYDCLVFLYFLYLLFFNFYFIIFFLFQLTRCVVYIAAVRIKIGTSRKQYATQELYTTASGAAAAHSI